MKISGEASPNLPLRGRGTDAPLFYGIAATGSYFRFNSLRDAPPGGEAFSAFPRLCVFSVLP